MSRTRSARLRRKRTSRPIQSSKKVRIARLLSIDSLTDPSPVTEYVPAASKILGSSKQPEEGTKSEDIPGPPERPHHDHKIEDFVRDQHRSKVEDGSIKLDGNGGS